jgi:hypothetical protein
MFMRGQIGPCPQWMAEMDIAEEVAAIEENWIKPGKMLSWQNFSDGFPIIGPKFLGVGEDDGLTLWFYTFPTFELFKVWALGARDVADYSFLATDAPRDQIPAMRAELREMYKQIEATDWAGTPPGAVQLMMLGDHD